MCISNITKQSTLPYQSLSDWPRTQALTVTADQRLVKSTFENKEKERNLSYCQRPGLSTLQL